LNEEDFVKEMKTFV